MKVCSVVEHVRMDGVRLDTCRVDHQWQWKIWGLKLAKYGCGASFPKKSRHLDFHQKIPWTVGFLQVLLGPTWLTIFAVPRSEGTWPWFSQATANSSLDGGTEVPWQEEVRGSFRFSGLMHLQCGVWGLSWIGTGLFGHPVIFPIATKPERKCWLKIESGFCCEELRYKAPKRQDTNKNYKRCVTSMHIAKV